MLIAALVLALSPAIAHGIGEVDESVEVGSVIVTDKGEPLVETGLRVQPGDRFIDPGNDEWTVYRIEGNRAVARRTAKLVLRLSRAEREALRRAFGERAAQAAAGAGGPADVVVYHTHSDESYTPTDGASSMPDKGSIYQVGSALTEALRQAGTSAQQRPDNHSPHDNGAYIRSRRTAMDSLEVQDPALLFDIHRDAAPAREYRYERQGSSVGKVLIVIGGSNPAHETNLAVAKLIKAQADGLEPGLIRGIYVGRGNYNQDLAAHNILLEAGTHLISREEAERGMVLLAPAVAAVLRELGAAGSEAVAAENAGAWRSIGTLLLMVVVGGGAWLVLVSGGWQPALARLKNWRQELWDPIRRR